MHAQELCFKQDHDSFCKYSYITDVALKPCLLIWHNISYDPPCFLMAEMLQNDLRPWWQELPKCWEGSRKAKSMRTTGAWLLNDPVPKFSCVSKRKWSFKLKSKCFVLSRKWWLFSWRKTVPSNHCHGTQKWHHTICEDCCSVTSFGQATSVTMAYLFSPGR